MRQFWLRKPAETVLRKFLAEQAPLDFSYVAVGATAASPPTGFVVDHTRQMLGRGQAVFIAARSALQQWRQFRLGWVEAWSPDPELQVGNQVAVLGRSLGWWCLNACRIVYLVDDLEPVARFGFAYGTLPGHLECGEERFLVEWNLATDQVWYDILAFSRPRHPLAKLGSPIVRRLQKRFARDSAAAMLRIR